MCVYISSLKQFLKHGFILTSSKYIRAKKKRFRGNSKFCFLTFNENLEWTASLYVSIVCNNHINADSWIQKVDWQLQRRWIENNTLDSTIIALLMCIASCWCKSNCSNLISSVKFFRSWYRACYDWWFGIWKKHWKSFTIYEGQSIPQITTQAKQFHK